MNEAVRSIAPWRLRLRESRLLLAFELGLIAAIFVADQHHLIFLSKTPYLVALGWISMALRGISWRDIGLRFDAKWIRFVFLGVIVGCAMEALELYVTGPLLASLTGQAADLSVFNNVHLSVQKLLMYIAFSFLIAGLGEELAWRGYILNRIVDLFGRGAGGWAAALVLVNIVFGLAHSYQDITGIAEAAIDGLLFGILYLATGRSLIAPIVAHGVTDAIDFLLIYSGHYPGMH